MSLATATLVAVSVAWAFALGDPAAIANAIAFTMTFAPLALLRDEVPAARFFVAVAGAWLALSGFVLGYAVVGDLTLGAALVAVSLRR